MSTSERRPNSRPDRLRADEMAQYEKLEGRWRAEGELGPHSTINGCEAKWRWLVQQIEAGYDNSQDEWGNDLASRAIVQRAIGELPHSLARRLATRVHPSDERFRALTQRVKKQHRTGDWWRDRLPLNLGPQLREELGDQL